MNSITFREIFNFHPIVYAMFGPGHPAVISLKPITSSNATSINIKRILAYRAVLLTPLLEVTLSLGTVLDSVFEGSRRSLAASNSVYVRKVLYDRRYFGRDFLDIIPARKWEAINNANACISLVIQP